MFTLETTTAGFLACFARCAAWAESAPVISDPIVPRRVRIAISGAVALSLAPLRTELTYPGLLKILPFDVLAGLLLGGATRLFLLAAEMGGQLIGIQLGLGFAGTFDPVARESALPTRRFAFALAGLAFVVVGGLEASVYALALPMIATAEILDAPLLTLIEGSERILENGVRLAAPLLVAGFVANITMAIASKAAPALNVFSVMLALFLVVGGLVLVATAPVFAKDIVAIAVLARDVFWGLAR